MRTGLFFFVCTLLFACTKEESLEDGNKGGLLVRAVSKVGGDSTATLYGYDGRERLILYQTVSAFQGTSNATEYRFVRNSAGIIQQVVLKSTFFATVGLDSLVYILNYDPVRQRYTSRVAVYDLFGFSIRDSTAFAYDAAGRVIAEETFIDDGVSGGYGESVRTVYTYDGQGNIIKFTTSEYDAASGTYEPALETTLEYDAKVNPLQLSIEAFVIGNPSMTSAHNPTKIEQRDLTNGDTEQTTITYTYNNQNKPETATATVSSLGGVPLVFTYYYN